MRESVSPVGTGGLSRAGAQKSNPEALDIGAAAPDDEGMNLLADLTICLRFFSRLPVPVSEREAHLGASGLARAAAMVPLAGAIIGLVPALVLLVAILVGLPALLAAPLAVATLVAITGALHEDGLADCADGFGGGATRERKLAIMRDSRIGTFGACAVALSLYIRAMALSLVAMRAPVTAVAVIVAVAALSRAAALLPLALLPSARAEGLGASAGQPALSSVAIAFGLALVMALFTLPFHAGAGHVAGAMMAATLAALAVCWGAQRQIGGQTGDVAGAAQQCAEIAALLAFAAAG